MGEADWVGNWVLFWWAGPCSVNLKSNFLLMCESVFPPCFLTWGQSVVVVMKIMLTSFKRSRGCTAALSAPDPAAGHRQPTSRPEILDPHRQDWGRLWSHKYCNFYKLEICGNLVSSKSIDAIFPNVFAHFMSLSHILGIPAILKIFIIVFVMVIMISDLWC